MSIVPTNCLENIFFVVHPTMCPSRASNNRSWRQMLMSKQASTKRRQSRLVEAGQAKTEHAASGVTANQATRTGRDLKTGRTNLMHHKTCARPIQHRLDTFEAPSKQQQKTLPYAGMTASQHQMASKQARPKQKHRQQLASKQASMIPFTPAPPPPGPCCES